MSPAEMRKPFIKDVLAHFQRGISELPTVPLEKTDLPSPLAEAGHAAPGRPRHAAPQRQGASPQLGTKSDGEGGGGGGSGKSWRGAWEGEVWEEPLRYLEIFF